MIGGVSEKKKDLVLKAQKLYVDWCSIWPLLKTHQLEKNSLTT